MQGVISLADLAQNPEKAEEELMTFDEMVNDIADKHDMTYNEALATLPENIKVDQQRRDVKYITRTVTLDVTTLY